MIQKVEIISLIDPTGASNAVLAVYYCATADTGGCAVNTLAMIPLAGKVLKYADEGLELGVKGLKVLGDSKLLAANLENMGLARLEGEAAHHMVAGNSPRAADARAVLEGFGLGVDAGPNGVFLPGNLSKPNPFGSSVHSTIHTDLYIAQINKSMLTFQGEAEVLDYLEYLRYLLQSGRPPGS